jgi:5'-nucleotidase
VNGASGAVVRKQVFAPQDLVTGGYEGHVVRPSAAVNAAIAPAVRRAMTLKTQPLGVVLETAFARGDQQHETAVADLITDGMLASVPSADVAIGNGGSLRTDLPAGPLTYGEVYELYPFDNRLVTLAMSGDQLTRIIAYNLTRRALPMELLPIAGFTVDAVCESGALRVTLTRSSGAPIRAEEQLSVLTSDFIAGGGDGILAPAGPLSPAQSVQGAPLLRESVVAWFRRRGGRLDANEYVSAVNRRWHFPASRPVMCS